MNTFSIQQIINSSRLQKLDIKVLLKHVLGLSFADLIIQSDRVLDDEEFNKLQHLVSKRLLGVPISYLLKYKEFYSRNFLVTEDTLIPRPETEILVEQVLNLAQYMILNQTQKSVCSHKKTIKLLDLGTGSGCIAITCKLENPLLDVVASDISAEALSVAKSNAKIFGVNIDFKISNWYQNVMPDLENVIGNNMKFDIIVSNPPYIACNDQHLVELQYEPLIALTDRSDGLSSLNNVISGATKYLTKGGFLLVEHGYNQKNAVVNFFKNYGFVDIITVLDYAGLDRVTLGKLF